MEYLASGIKDVDNTADFTKYASCMTLLNEYLLQSKKVTWSLTGVRNTTVSCQVCNAI